MGRPVCVGLGINHGTVAKALQVKGVSVVEMAKTEVLQETLGDRSQGVGKGGAEGTQKISEGMVCSEVCSTMGHVLWEPEKCIIHLQRPDIHTGKVRNRYKWHFEGNKWGIKQDRCQIAFVIHILCAKHFAFVIKINPLNKAMYLVAITHCWHKG